MDEFNQQTVYVDAQEGLRAYLTGIFTKMSIGILVTALVALGIVFSGLMYNMFYSGTFQIAMIIGVIAQFGIVIALGRGLSTLKPSTATALFYIYAAINGFSFSFITAAYGLGVAGFAFLFTAVLFISCAIIGHFTNVDLSKFSSIFMGALIALVIATVVGMFVPAVRDSLLLSYAGVLIFSALTAWDVQRLKVMYLQSNGGYGVLGQNLAIYGAFQLYLDFINIFLYVLRILGRRRD